MSSKNDGTENVWWELNKVQFRPPSCFSVCFATVPNLTLKVAVGRGWVRVHVSYPQSGFFWNEKWKKWEKLSRIGYLIQATFSQIKKKHRPTSKGPPSRFTYKSIIFTRANSGRFLFNQTFQFIFPRSFQWQMEQQKLYLFLVFLTAKDNWETGSEQEGPSWSWYDHRKKKLISEII